MSKLFRLAAALKGAPVSRDTFNAVRVALAESSAASARVLCDALSRDPVVILSRESLELYRAILAALPDASPLSALLTGSAARLPDPIADEPRHVLPDPPATITVQPYAMRKGETYADASIQF